MDNSYMSVIQEFINVSKFHMEKCNKATPHVSTWCCMGITAWKPQKLHSQSLIDPIMYLYVPSQDIIMQNLVTPFNFLLKWLDTKFHIIHVLTDTAENNSRKSIQNAIEITVKPSKILPRDTGLWMLRSRKNSEEFSILLMDKMKWIKWKKK